MRDLVGHVSEVYEHKVECIRQGKEPDPWPPEVGEHDPIERFDAALASITAELTMRDPSDHAYSWYDPDQTVGFWIRRMPHETVVHRADAELAAGLPVSPIAHDLAADGVDEALTWFPQYAHDFWPDYFASDLPGPGGQTARWLCQAAGWQMAAVDETRVKKAAAEATIVDRQHLARHRRRPAAASDHRPRMAGRSQVDGSSRPRSRNRSRHLGCCL